MSSGELLVERVDGRVAVLTLNRPEKRNALSIEMRYELAAVFAKYDVPDDHVRKITHENAMRWYSFDPFGHVPKEDATVGALRRRAEGHDVSIMSRSTRVRTPDEKLEGFRQRARRAVAAAGN